MKKLDLELAVGLLLLVVIATLTYISIRLGDIGFSEWGYTVYADFATAGGLQSGAVVELAGVEIGRVESVDLANYQARVALKIRHDIELQDDAVVTIRSKGLIGERYIEVTPGRAETLISPGSHIRQTESPIDIEDLLGGLIFGANLETPDRSGASDREPTLQENSDPWALDLE